MFMAADLANLGPYIRNLIPFMGPMCLLNFLLENLDIDGDRTNNGKNNSSKVDCTFYFFKICTTVDEDSFPLY
jgi:hypothetical protein